MKFSVFDSLMMHFPKQKKSDGSKFHDLLSFVIWKKVLFFNKRNWPLCLFLTCKILNIKKVLFPYLKQ